MSLLTIVKFSLYVCWTIRRYENYCSKKRIYAVKTVQFSNDFLKRSRRVCSVLCIFKSFSCIIKTIINAHHDCICKIFLVYYFWLSCLKARRLQGKDRSGLLSKAYCARATKQVPYTLASTPINTIWPLQIIGFFSFLSLTRHSAYLQAPHTDPLILLLTFTSSQF